MCNIKLTIHAIFKRFTFSYVCWRVESVHMRYLQRPEKEGQIQAQELQMAMSHPVWLLGTQLRSYAGALHLWAISQALHTWPFLVPSLVPWQELIPWCSHSIIHFCDMYHLKLSLHPSNVSCYSPHGPAMAYGHSTFCLCNCDLNYPPPLKS